MDLQAETQAMIDKIFARGVVIDVHVDHDLADGPPNNGWETKVYTGRHTLTVTWQDAQPKNVVGITANLEGKVKLT